jgi:signal transduction histidine kinase
MTTTTSAEAKPNILIVDDTPANLQLLAGMLKERGYQPRPVPSGKLALQAAQADPPDLVLLDINMPEMNGYEVCARLKADPRLRDIPVIFLSALSETLDKVRAFQTGGVDYVTKPFQFEEVEARVLTHLELRQQKRALEQSYERLRELERLRDNLVHMIVHDLRSPLSAIMMALEILDKSPTQPPQTSRRVLAQAKGAAAKLAEMVTQMLDISRLEAGQMPLNRTDCDLNAIARAAIDALGGLGSQHRLVLLAPQPLKVVGDADLLRRIIANLLANAIKFTPKEGEIQVGISQHETHARVTVSDTGPGIPPEYHEKVFEKFGQVEGASRKLGAGLGLSFCKLAVEAQGGQIGLESGVGKGSTFWFTMPLAGSSPTPGSAEWGMRSAQAEVEG